MANIIPYREFLKRKELCEQETGITVSSQQLHPSLFDWQKRIVTWACKVGRAAVWADTGLGKTRMQLEWLRQVCAGHGTGLILAPLAVCQQTIREGAAIGMEVRYVHDQSEVSDGFNITNYERVPKLDVSKFNAVVLDEASILKQSDGKTRKMLIDTFRDTEYRLACTATPAPNDPEELCNQAEFLGYATRVKMLATYFVHDGNIRETNTLNERLGREDTDERHICPLQLDFIERCIRLWSNKGELVFDPFGGIGSTVYEAIKLGRKGMSIELKPSYWDASVNLMRDLEEKLGEATLF